MNQDRHFVEELEELKQLLLTMGGLAEERLRLAVRGLVDRDHEALDEVIAGDARIDDLQIEVDKRCFTLLALYRVLRQDDWLDALKDQVFREVLTYMLGDSATIEPGINLILISRHLERVGDHATNIAEDVIFIVHARDVRHRTGLPGPERRRPTFIGPI